MFDPNAYWLHRGKSYIGEKRLGGVFYRQQEEFIVATVAALKPASILEVGCGFGRVTRCIAKALPETIITAVDLSDAQIRNAREYCSELRNVQFGEHDLYSGQSFPEAYYELAIAMEVFQHHPAAAVGRFLSNMLRVSPRVLHDFNLGESPQDVTAEHCFAHDWPAIYSQAVIEVVSQYESGPHALRLLKEKR